MIQFNFGGPSPPQVSPEDLYNQRLRACEFCIHRNVIMNTCSQVEKIIPIYAKNFNNKCPVSKWP